MRKWMLLSVLFALTSLGMARAQDATPEATPGETSPYVGDPAYPAPDFPAGLDWINVSAPLTMQSLRGKVIVLDFWTYGCINCIHMIPTLQKLEAKYGSALQIVGVHSAKFANEGQTENIREIVQRYGLEHPVINDNEFKTWNLYQPYGVSAWPTFVMIDPRGNLLAVQPGEIPYEGFDAVIGGIVNYYDGLGEIDRTPIHLALEGAGLPGSTLAFPGKVLADPTGSRLFIADSNHNRIVVADLQSYQVEAVIGTGAASLTDGAYDSATFDKPQGMALDGSTLYVADTYNNAIRAIDLDKKTVTTAAGTGAQGYAGIAQQNPTQVALSSPWDVVMGPGHILYIAMAGQHQIWALRLDKGVIGPVVGSGYEGMENAGFKAAQLAQPSGLYLADDQLYFADSESSSVRVADLGRQIVTSLAGPTINDLFDFGDTDGSYGTSRLQHPLGVTGGPDGTIFVADTYNSRVKKIDPATKTTTTVFGLDDSGFHDGDSQTAQFYEPGGLSYANGKLYVADTNNNAIRVIDLAAGQVSTVSFPNPEALQIADQITVAGGNSAAGEHLTLDAQTVKAGTGSITLRITLPDGYKINDQAPSYATWTSGGKVNLADETANSGHITTATVSYPVMFTEGSDTLHGELAIYYCEAVHESLCYLDALTVDLPVTVSRSATSSDLVVERSITPPKVVSGSLP